MELGVASALFELVKAQEVNIYRVSSEHDSHFLERITHVGADGLRYVSEFDDVDAVVPLATRPEMVACVEHSQIVRRLTQDGGSHVHCFPIGGERGVLGVLEVRRDKPLADDDLGTAEGFLGLYRNYLKLLDYSERDTLTGMLNRKTFDENLSKILIGMAASQADGEASDRRRGRPQEDGSFWLAVVDLDHFKRINDQFGHLYGDEVLLLLARIMRDSFRHQDKVFRFGGEEFVVVLKAVSEEEVRAALERFRVAVATYPFPQVGQVTASIGYTCIHADDTIPEIVGRADEALYVAKDNGRDQIAGYETLRAAGKIATREKPANDIELF